MFFNGIKTTFRHISYKLVKNAIITDSKKSHKWTFKTGEKRYVCSEGNNSVNRKGTRENS